MKKQLNKGAKSTKKVQKANKVSEYRTNVLNVAKEIREKQKTTGGARALILAGKSELGTSVPADFVLILQASKKDTPDGKALYKYLDGNVRKSEKGHTCMFYLLQLLHKVHVDLIKMVK